MSIRLFRLEDNNAHEQVRILPFDLDQYNVAYHWADNVRQVKCEGALCKYCLSGSKPRKLFAIPLYSEKDKCIKYWFRTEFSVETINRIIKNYGHNPENYVFNIIRNGAKGDPKTYYEFICLGIRKSSITQYTLDTPEEVFAAVFPDVSEE